MIDPAVYVGVKKMEGKSWWQITVRLGNMRHNVDFYLLGARWRIATLEEQVRRLTEKARQLQETVYEYEEKYGVE